MDLDKLEERLLKIQAPLKKTTKKLMGFQKSLIKGIILYGIIMFVFITVYQRFGFEYTVIALGVSMITAGLRNMLKV